MIDHVYLPVTDVAGSRAFYRDLLGTVGIEESFTLDDSVVFGAGAPGAFWIYPTSGRTDADDDPCGLDPETDLPLLHAHIAFRVETRQQVRDFFEAAQRLGAIVVSPPGLHPQYHAAYFATFIRDPDGHYVEAVCHAPG
jgi:catechol 2,3-dioxygenase-like lactoylglutathione lyase family enzyme